MLTRQLQELWKKSRGSLVPQRLLFEVTSASVVSERSSKYVVSEPGGAGWTQNGHRGGHGSCFILGQRSHGAGAYFSLSFPVLLGRCWRLR